MGQVLPGVQFQERRNAHNLVIVNISADAESLSPEGRKGLGKSRADAQRCDLFGKPGAI
jgi:hypothetical protein